MVVTRFSWMYYAGALMFFIAFLFIGSLLVFYLADLYRTQGINGGICLVLTFALPAYAYMIYVFVKHIINVKEFKIDSNTITVGKKSYPLSDIYELKFDYDVIFPYTPCSGYGACVKFENGDVEYFCDDYYANAWQVKTFLHQVVEKKQNYSPVEVPLYKREVISGVVKTFNNSILISWRIMLMPVISFLMTILDSEFAKRDVVVFIALPVGYVLLHFFCLYYFQVTDDYLIVRHHLLFWRKRIYKLSDIDHMSRLGVDTKLPDKLRIVTRDYKSTLYYAATLHGKTWDALEEELKSRGMKIK